MIREDITKYFDALKQLKQANEFTMRNAWEFLIKTFGLTPNGALDVVEMFSNYYVKKLNLQY